MQDHTQSGFAGAKFLKGVRIEFSIWGMGPSLPVVHSRPEE